MARALDAKEEEWEELAAASPDEDFLQAKAKFHTEVLDDIRSQIQDHVNLPLRGHQRRGTVHRPDGTG
jgi:hypothetical protein